ncbi:MAG TPA: Ku protein [Hypericibacter adhaerens]|jgi:DNA end-binding protein Ku|uniref:Non-homologous end joining protein Ku n=1 Tax=Hypericibacter adhaerens TaxID=2602016 RepID=A0A5J6MZT9_9PROT|nr:Ku protein [Hypericibacter adhaerens]QEX22687.1 non-homologous end joining protein Ku [Hypericibacter adhaerens]HWA42868.1 Ku protein [Hypericibacter adhaerens]
MAEPKGARPTWSGAIRLSLVVLPVAIYRAVDVRSEIRFHQIHKPTGKRVRHLNVVPGQGAVEREDIAKGYEYSKDQYVLIEPDELKALRLESKDSFSIVRFVDRNQIDAIYFEEPFFVVPDGEAAMEAFVVIRDALRSTKRIGLGQIVLSGRERIAALQPCGKGMLLETLRYAEDLRKAEDYFAGIKNVPVDKDQLGLAQKLIEQKTGDFEPDRFKDHYENALRELIERKLKSKGRRIQVEEPERKGAEVIDLMEALRRSVGRRSSGSDSETRIDRGPQAPAPRKKRAAPSRAPGRARKRA